MRQSPKFTIRSKFLTVTSLLLAGCVVLYLFIAVSIFKTDKEAMVFDLNRSLVSNVSSELETQLSVLSDKIELFAVAGYEKELKKEFVENLLQKNKEIVYVGTWKSLTDNESRLQMGYHRKDFDKTYGVEENYYSDRLFEEKKNKIREMIETGEALWNATLENGPPLIGYARSVAIEDSSGRPMDRVAVVAFIDASRFVSLVTGVETTEISITSGEGEVLIHRDPKKMIQNNFVKDSVVFTKAKQSPVRKEVLQTVVDQEQVLGAFAKVFNDRVYVLAEAKGRDAFAVVDDLIRRSFIFSLIVLTVAFIAAGMFSRSLTRPLETLTEAMDRVSQGDLQITTEIRTRDEIEYLSRSFNQMIDDLRRSRAELEEINRELENKVKERTLQLERQNQAVKEAQEALLNTTRLAAVGEIAGRAAHEVLNPLTSMMARLENVQKRLGAQEPVHLRVLEDIRKAWEQDYQSGGFPLLVENWQKASGVLPGANLWQEDVKNIQSIVLQWKSEVADLMKDSRFLFEEAERISRIVGQMRSMSVVKSSDERTSLWDLLCKSRDVMADLMEKHGIDFRVEPVERSIEIQMDRDEFVQSLTNLLRNSQQSVTAAKEQNPQHKGFVTVWAKPQGGRVEIFIEDNGMGITKEHQSKLFVSQFSTKSKDEGTGLGLSISRRFLRAAGGDIELLDSEPLKHTVFHIVLPVANSKEVAA